MKTLQVILFVLAAVHVHGQEYFEIDLAGDREVEEAIGLQYSGVKLVNMVQQNYTVKIDVELEAGGQGPEIMAKVACDVDAITTQVRTAATEPGVAKAITDLKTLIENETDAAKKECLKAALQHANDITSEVRKFYFDLEKNQNIYVTIKRGNETWKVKLKTLRAVNHITHFGFTFVPRGVRNSDRYFSKESAAGTYIITPLNDNGKGFWKDLSLTANYIIPVWRPLRKSNEFIVAVNGGFGLGGDGKYVVMTGASFVIQEFLSISFNGGLHHGSKLKGEYERGQELTENLSVDQLNETGIQPAFMISLGFRLAKDVIQPVETRGAN